MRSLRSAARCLRVAAAVSWPLITTRPFVGVSRRPMRFRRVDLPEPDWPITAANSAACNSNETSLRATVLTVVPYVLPSSSAASSTSATLDHLDGVELRGAARRDQRGEHRHEHSDRERDDDEADLRVDGE